MLRQSDGIDAGSIDWGEIGQETPSYILGAPGADMHAVRLGAGRPLLMIHGLGGSHRSWATIVGALADEREVIAVDLPGFGDSSPLPGRTSLEALADAVGAFLQVQGLAGVDMVGSSVGASLVLELARRGHPGAVISLDPEGFWSKAQKLAFAASLTLSIQLARRLRPGLAALCRTRIGRSLLVSPYSARPWRLPSEAVLTEMRDYARASRFDELLKSLVSEPSQYGMKSSRSRPLVIGWGRQDRLCFPGQAQRASDLFPHARVHWFDRCGHFPHWDQPAETVKLILETTSR